ncbi:MAG: lysophospholipid acyltransferase family protein [Kiritimatiellia bacterium]
MIETQDFLRTLRTDFGYRTPVDVRKRFLDRAFGRRDFWFYRRMMGVVLRGRSLYRAGLYNRENWQDLSLDMWRAVEGCGGRFAVTGLEHLEVLRGPAVIVANHMSLLETFTIPAMVLPFTHMTFVVKEELMRVPLFRSVMLGVQPIVVTRGNPREDMRIIMEEGQAVLSGGRSIVVFPQSTRSNVLHPGQFNSVAVKLAKRANVPVVPLALKTDFQGLGKWVKDIGKVHRDRMVHFCVGEPLTVAGNGREQHQQVLRFIAAQYRSWGGAVEG